MPIQIRNTEIANLQSPDGFNYGLWTEVIAGFQAIPGLVGFWPMSSIQRSTGNVYDLSGQGRTLTRNGNSYGIENLVPYANFNGTTDFLSRADETDLDITGTEGYYASPGLTFGGWFYANAGSSNAGLITKRTGGGGNFSYYLRLTGTDDVTFTVSSNGTIETAITIFNVMPTSRWTWCVGRFIPNNFMRLFVNDRFSTISAPASIFAGAGVFNIGAYDSSAGFFSGRATLCFLSANALSDSIINGLYQRSRLLFGV